MHHIIANPIAGKGKTINYLSQLSQKLEAENIPFQAHVTTKVMDAFEIAHKFAKASDTKTIISIGGDGTIQEIAAGIIAAGKDSGDKANHVSLGVIAAGSGNDFGMSLLGSKETALKLRSLSIEDFVEDFYNKLISPNLQTIDMITANGTPCINISNIGIDARIVNNAAALKPRFGRYAYLAAVYKSIVQHRNLKMKIQVDGVDFDGKYTLIAACNGRYYGGGMEISPFSKLNDGKITLCLVEGMSRLKTMMVFPSIMMGLHTKLKVIQYIECSSIAIKLDAPTVLCIDGNLMPETDEINFEILPQALEVFI